MNKQLSRVINGYHHSERSQLLTINDKDRALLPQFSSTRVIKAAKSMFELMALSTGPVSLHGLKNLVRLLFSFLSWQPFIIGKLLLYERQRKREWEREREEERAFVQKLININSNNFATKLKSACFRRRKFKLKHFLEGIFLSSCKT